MEGFQIKMPLDRKLSFACYGDGSSGSSGTIIILILLVNYYFIIRFCVHVCALQKQQSLLMLDRKRVSVLYIPSGKTKRKIPQLSDVVTSAVCMTTTPSGEMFVDSYELKACMHTSTYVHRYRHR